MVGSATTPLKPKEGLNGPPKHLLEGHFSLYLPQASRAARDLQFIPSASDPEWSHLHFLNLLLTFCAVTLLVFLA
jgi:hypothetical protein